MAAFSNGGLRTFKILFLKNVLVRKNHWLGTLINQLLVPVLTFFAYHVMSSGYVVNVRSKPDYLTYLANNMGNFTSDSYLETYDSAFCVIKDEKLQPQIQNMVQSCSSPRSTLRFFKEENKATAEYSKSEGIRKLLLIFTSEFVDKTFHYSMALPDELESRFDSIQYCLNMEIIKEFGKTKQLQPPFTPYRLIGEIPNKNLWSYHTTIVFAIQTFVIPMMFEAAYITNEKNLGVNVLLQMNGVSITQHLLSWFVSGVLFSIIYFIPSMVMLFIEMFHVPPAYTESNMLIIVCMFFLHCTHFLSFGYFIASFMTRPIMVKLFIMVSTTVCCVVYFSAAALQSAVPYFGMFLPGFLFTSTMSDILNTASFENGIHWSNLFDSWKLGGSAGQSVGVALILSLLGTVFYFFMTVYIQNVKPGKFGAPKHYLYFLPCLNRKVNSSESLSERLDYGEGDIPFEKPEDNAIAGIQIRDLKKSFPCGIFTKACVSAIKGVSVDFYKDHITSLLGHNGAGKTTMMSIITGMMNASEGSVMVNGKSIETDMDEIYSDIGLCPQEDMFFPDLSVYQHLMFFGMLKRKNDTKAQISQDVEGILRQLNIVNKRNELPTKLSGGQKRRLCFGMALIGKATTLILDEPTSGMDPESRREAWDVILGMRAGKTIIITTHDMEEADVLGDRIAIMHEGTLRCDATSMFLKKFYGQGNMQVSLSVTENCQPQNVLNILNPEGTIMSSGGTRLEMNVPISDGLPDALDNLEARKHELGVTGASVSLISLEQIFLEISKDETAENFAKEDFQSRVTGKLAGNALFFQRIFAMLAKKFTYTCRNPASFLVMIILPIVAVSMIGVINNSSSNSIDDRNIPINLNMFNAPEFEVSGISETDPLWKKLDQVTKSAGGSVHTHASKHKMVASMDVSKFMTPPEVHVKCTARTPFASRATVYALSNALLKQYIGDDYSIETNYLRVPDKTATGITMDLIWKKFGIFLFTFAIVSVSAFFVVHPQKEAISGLKHLQIMVGVSPAVYWGTMFIFDFTVGIGIASIAFLAMALTDMIGGFVQIGIMYLTLFLYFANALPFIYILTLWKKPVSFSTKVLVIGPMVLGMVYNTIMSLQMSELISVTIFNLISIVFRLIPQISYLVVMSKLTVAVIYDKQMEKPMSWYWRLTLPEGLRVNEETIYTIGTDILVLCGTAVIYTVILMLLEYKLISRVMKMISRRRLVSSLLHTADEMVAREKQLVSEQINNINGNHLDTVSHALSSTDSENTTFLAHELSKRYKNIQAVREVSFHVKERECFGLLGINGAGKTTTFRMLIGEERPDTGLMYLDGNSFRTDLYKYLSHMGYCPQISSILKSLNTIDHLRLFALLRGVPKNEVEPEIENWIKRMNLKACASRPSGTYSGGNKRRLSVAIAMMAEPNLVLLDEPTTGVDPGARRSLWNVINAAQRNGQSIILTSHSMDECEALCDRLAIMVDGAFVCLGASQELKQRFGAGFNVLVRLQQGHSVLERNFLKEHMFSTMLFDLTDENSSLLTYHVKGSFSWRSLYDTMYGVQQKFLCVEDFVVVSGTLEQLFLQFAQAAKNVPTLGQ